MQQELFGDCGFARIRVRDDGKGPAQPNLFRQFQDDLTQFVLALKVLFRIQGIAARRLAHLPDRVARDSSPF